VRGRWRGFAFCKDPLPRAARLGVGVPFGFIGLVGYLDEQVPLDFAVVRIPGLVGNSGRISGIPWMHVFKDLRKGGRDGGHAGQAPACRTAGTCFDLGAFHHSYPEIIPS